MKFGTETFQAQFSKIKTQCVAENRSALLVLYNHAGNVFGVFVDVP